MSTQFCDKSGGQGSGSDHVCRCSYGKGHPLTGDWPHGCPCGAVWVDLEELDNAREDFMEQALKDPVGVALVEGIHAKIRQRARLREQVLEEAARELENAREWGGAYGQHERRPSNFRRAAGWVRALKFKAPAT